MHVKRFAGGKKKGGQERQKKSYFWTLVCKFVRELVRSETVSLMSVNVAMLTHGGGAVSNSPVILCVYLTTFYTDRQAVLQR